MKKTRYKSDWILLVVFCVLAFFTLMYKDMDETTTKGFNLLDSLFRGNFPGGYEFESAFYIPVHIAFALWCLPLWLLSLTGLCVSQTMVYFLWSKLLLVVCLFAILRTVSAILKEINSSDQSDFWSIFIVSSLLIFCPIFDMSQYDCIGLSIGLYALLMITRDPSRLTFKELLIMSLASCFKFFFWIAAIATVFVLERRFKKIIADIGAVSIFSVFFVVLAKVLNALKDKALSGAEVADSTVIAPVEDISLSMSDRMFASTIDGGIYKIGLFFLLLFALYFLILCSEKPKEKRELVYELVFTIATSYFLGVTFTLAHPQWFVYPALFIILLISMSRKSRLKRNSILEMVFEASTLIQQVTYYYWVYISETEFDYLVLKNKKSCLSGFDIKSLSEITNAGGGRYMIVLSSLALVSGAALLILNNPWRPDADSITDESAMKRITDVRVIFIGLYLAASFAVRFIV